MNYRTNRTLGSKSKLFEWMFNPKIGLKIRRQFSTGERVDTFSINEIEQIVKYTMSKGNIPLANNIVKIHNGTEIKGLGSFIYNQLEKDLIKAQSSSQLVAILVNKGIFDYNGLSRNMEFWIKNSDWQLLLMND